MTDIVAIYQYKIDFIPRQPIFEKHGEIPSKLFIDDDGWKRHFEKEDLDSEYDFEDALTIPWWKDQKISFKDIEPFIDSFANQMEWTKTRTDIKSYGDSETNDFSFMLTEESNIEEFGCRMDLRKLDNNFIENIFMLARRINCLLIDRKGNLFEPTLDKLVENLKTSNSFKFVSNSTDFLDKISSGQIKPE